MAVCNFSLVISDKNPCKMFSTNSCNYDFSDNDDNKGETPLVIPVLPRENRVMKSRNFHGTLQSNNFACFNLMKFCRSGAREVLIILFCKPQQRYFDLYLKNKF